MITVFDCIATRHDPWLVVLAVIVCCLGAFASVRLLAHTLAARGTVKLAWRFLTALAIGTSVWTTHFVAILAYVARAPVGYDPTLTILSLLVAVCGVKVALTVGTLERKGPLPAIGGALFGLAVAAMHYLGMLAYRIDGVVHWQPGFVAASILLAAGLGAAWLAAVRGQLAGARGVRAAPALLVLTILTLHFTGMAALRVVPIDASHPGLADGAPALALATAIAAALIFASAGFAHLIDATALREADERIAMLAQTDTLTELPNRAALEAELRERVRNGGKDEGVALFVMQIADIGEINQRFGGSIADQLFKAFARRLAEAATPGVFLARTGSAQFSVIGPADRTQTWDGAHRIHETFARGMFIEGHEIPVDVRVGAAIYPLDAEDADWWMRKAQAALGRAMADPLEPVAVHDEAVEAEVQRRISLASDLRGALDRHEFALFYQPQVWVADRHVIGYEALLRWYHPEFGVVSPTEFVPLAEKTGLILPIGEWALFEACREAARWSNGGRVAVNVSPLQLRQPDLPEKVHTALVQSGLSPDRLEIELTESLLIEDRNRALLSLRRIKALGVRLVLDDFGTGYSSLEVLRLLPFDKVKLDKCFMEDLETNPQARAILHAMLMLGRTLSIPILIEGVETERQFAILREEGCNKVQGFLTGRPMPGSLLPEGAAERLSA